MMGKIYPTEILVEILPVRHGRSVLCFWHYPMSIPFTKSLKVIKKFILDAAFKIKKSRLSSPAPHTGKSFHAKASRLFTGPVIQRMVPPARQKIYRYLQGFEARGFPLLPSISWQRRYIYWQLHVNDDISLTPRFLWNPCPTPSRGRGGN